MLRKRGFKEAGLDDPTRYISGGGSREKRAGEGYSLLNLIGINQQANRKEVPSGNRKWK
jgi:hypothetical protein